MRSMGWCLSIDGLPGEDAEQLKAWLRPIMDAVDAAGVASDDADTRKKVCDESGRSQQVCKSPVGRTTDAMVSELLAIIKGGAGSFFGWTWNNFSSGIGGLDCTPRDDPFAASGRSITP